MHDATWPTSLGKSLIAASVLTVWAGAALAQHPSCTHSIRQIAGHGSGSSASIDANFACLLDELAQARAEIERLTAEIATVRTNSEDGVASAIEAMQVGLAATSENMQSFQQPIPEGAVVAFDRSDLDENTCPEGWEPYREARARMILGAGEPGVDSTKLAFDEKGDALTWYTLRQHGGEEAVALRTREMPPHAHTGTTGEPDISAVHRSHGTYRIPFAAEADIPDIFEDDIEYDAALSHVHAFETEATGGGNAHQNMPPYIALYFCKKT